MELWCDIGHVVSFKDGAGIVYVFNFQVLFDLRIDAVAIPVSPKDKVGGEMATGVKVLFAINVDLRNVRAFTIGNGVWDIWINPETLPSAFATGRICEFLRNQPRRPSGYSSFCIV